MLFMTLTDFVLRVLQLALCCKQRWERELGSGGVGDGGKMRTSTKHKLNLMSVEKKLGILENVNEWYHIKRQTVALCQ